MFRIFSLTRGGLGLLACLLPFTLSAQAQSANDTVMPNTVTTPQADEAVWVLTYTVTNYRSGGPAAINVPMTLPVCMKVAQHFMATDMDTIAATHCVNTADGNVYSMKHG